MSCEKRAFQAESKAADLVAQVKAAHTRAAQAEDRAAQAEARATDLVTQVKAADDRTARAEATATEAGSRATEAESRAAKAESRAAEAESSTKQVQNEIACLKVQLQATEKRRRNERDEATDQVPMSRVLFSWCML